MPRLLDQNRFIQEGESWCEERIHNHDEAGCGT